MALLVKVPAAKANDLSSIPGTQMVEAENQLSPLSFDLHMYVVCVLGFLLLWSNTMTQINLGSKGFISLTLPYYSPSQKEDN